MFKEIAIEPEVMARWEWFLAVYEKFGFDKGLLLAEYPGDWRKKVMERARELVFEGINQDIKVSSMIKRIRSEKFKSCLYSNGRIPGNSKNWLADTIEQEPEFDVIVAFLRDALHPRQIPAEDFFWEDERFLPKTQDRVPRTTKALIGTAAKLLTKAKQIRFIDRFFNPNKPEKREPFVALIDFIHGHNCPAKRIQIYTQLTLEEATPDDYKNRLEHELPSGFSLEVFFLKKIEGGENLHPRFILGDIGGLQYDHGLDEGDGTCIVHILNHDLRSQIWEEYSPESKVFDRHPKYPRLVLGSSI
jgi:hypothetical protein